ncbi:MAG TPA: hypothetical protein VND19_18725 [Acetobacteraceae bacterium]|nr:hypothetical protein [Acetobacteraceae bacterium]
MDAGPDIIAALADPDLFGPHFRPHAKHGDTWTRWRCFLRALFALPPEPGDLEIYIACTGRRDWPTEPATEAALIVGRRGGKSRILALIAVFLATFRDYSEYLAPGEIGAVAVIATDRKQARAIFRFAHGLLKHTELLAPMVADSNTESITLTNRTMIEIGTASFRSVRGATLIAALCDEIAFWRTDESSSNPDTEILRALRPALGTIPGAMLLLASSPYAKKGELYRTFRQYYAQPNADVLIWQASTATMNPGFPAKTLEREYEKDPESARAEYGAEFRDDLVDFISREAIDAITATGRHELPPDAGTTYAGFCDPSGGSSDSMTLAVAHLDGDLGVLDAILEIRAPFDPDVAVTECAGLLRRYSISRIVGDRYAGNWPVARFAAHGITFEQCARPKSDLYHDFLPLANARRIELLDLPRLTAQLTGLERRTARSGKDSIDHPPGAHDDVANAVAGVLTLLDLDRRPALLRRQQLLVDDAPVPLPRGPQMVTAVLIVALSGIAAVAYLADLDGAGLVLLDFDVGPMTGATFGDAARRLQELSIACETQYGGQLSAIWCAEPLLPQLQHRGIPCEAIPPELLLDPAALALSAAGHVACGDVKIAMPAHSKAKDSPLAGALTFRAGEDMAADPLRMALLAGIVIGLDPRRMALAG